MADTTQKSALRNMAAQMPVANQRVAQQQQATRDMQLQAAVQKATPAQATVQNAQQTGTALAQQAGAAQVQQVQNAAEGQQQIQQLGQQVQQLEAQKNTAGLQTGLQDQQLSDSQKLAGISEQAKKEMFDSRMDFSKDEMGRKFSNERQLADYAKIRAKTEDDWLSYTQRTEQLYARKSQMLTVAHQKLLQQIQQENVQMDQIRNQLSTKNLTYSQQQANRAILEKKQTLSVQLQQSEIWLQEAMAREQARTANRQAKNQAMGSIGGAVLGAIVGGAASGGNPQAASAGAGAGAGLGGGIVTLTNG